jgi:hypothetical protein
VVAKIIRGPEQERLIRKGLRADRAGTYKGKPVFAEVDCKRLRGNRWRCWYTLYDKKTSRVLLSRVCPPRRRKSV